MNQKMNCKYNACTFEVVSHGPRKHYCRVTGGCMKYNDRKGIFVFQAGGLLYGGIPIKGYGRNKAKKALEKQLKRDRLVAKIRIVDENSNPDAL